MLSPYSKWMVFMTCPSAENTSFKSRNSEGTPSSAFREAKGTRSAPPV